MKVMPHDYKRVLAERGRGEDATAASTAEEFARRGRDVAGEPHDASAARAS